MVLDKIRGFVGDFVSCIILTKVLHQLDSLSKYCHQFLKFGAEIDQSELLRVT